MGNWERRGKNQRMKEYRAKKRGDQGMKLRDGRALAVENAFREAQMRISVYTTRMKNLENCPIVD